jgi:hypothetical protein
MPKVQLIVETILTVGLQPYDVISSGDYEPGLSPFALDKAASIHEEFRVLDLRGGHPLGQACWSTLCLSPLHCHDLGALPLLTGKWQDLKFVQFQA